MTGNINRDGKVIACMLADRRAMQRFEREQGIPEEDRFAPTVEHSLTECDSCGRSVWIGPKQREIHNSPFIRTTIACVLCLSEAYEVLGAEPDIIFLNQDIDQVRPRY